MMAVCLVGAFHHDLGPILEGVGDDPLVGDRKSVCGLLFHDQEIDLRPLPINPNGAGRDVPVDAQVTSARSDFFSINSDKV